MTREQLIGLVKLNIGNAGDVTESQVDLNLCLAWEQMLTAIYYQKPQSIDRFAITSKPTAIVRDSTFGVYYSDLPLAPIRFVDTAEGLRRIYKQKQMAVDGVSPGDDIIFVPMPVQQTQLISQVDGGMVSDVIGYYIKDQRVYYFQHNPEITSVYMDIVPPLDKVDYEQELAIPEGGVQMLIGIVQEILRGTPYVDPRLRKINLQEI
jgi:hypothetical protein